MAQGGVVAGPFRTKARGRKAEAWVEADHKGRQRLRCSGCGLDRAAPGLLPNGPKARRHAATCTA